MMKRYLLIVVTLLPDHLDNLIPKEAAKRYLSAILYGIGEIKGLNFEYHSAVLDFLSKLGFKTNKEYQIFSNIDEVMQYCASWSEKKSNLILILMEWLLR